MEEPFVVFMIGMWHPYHKRWWLPAERFRIVV